ncbi:MAG: hypothetical protein AVDCRST_MAG58-4195 [uncultured Rubrobacteraceae bacterium]|uniref:Uncharacterized protein n=1 Tax=uncultured Rubrobacteraceae bacterium TaxID=349277 RepID=A0A6J4RD88_9ACTN|nr:MAG: hypothetical protein AVDCRST_MAG58-4195 [uncultured Rubrobacteraceae bacterium]
MSRRRSRVSPRSDLDRIGGSRQRLLGASPPRTSRRAHRPNERTSQVPPRRRCTRRPAAEHARVEADLREVVIAQRNLSEPERTVVSGRLPHPGRATAQGTEHGVPVACGVESVPKHASRAESRGTPQEIYAGGAVISRFEREIGVGVQERFGGFFITVAPLGRRAQWIARRCSMRLEVATRAFDPEHLRQEQVLPYVTDLRVMDVGHRYRILREHSRPS